MRGRGEDGADGQAMGVYRTAGRSSACSLGSTTFVVSSFVMSGMSSTFSAFSILPVSSFSSGIFEMASSAAAPRLPLPIREDASGTTQIRDTNLLLSVIVQILLIEDLYPI